MTNVRWALFAALLITPSTVQGQARIVSAPPEDDLHIWPHSWGAESSLGDLRVEQFDSSDLELRFWGGFGIVGTFGLIVRRKDSVWSASFIEIRSCGISIPLPIADTLSSEGWAYYREQARNHCGDTEPSQMPSRVAYVEVVVMSPLNIDGTLPQLWQDIVTSGLLTLPPKVERDRIMLDGHTVVVEVRTGDEYRVSVIECVGQSEVLADRQIRRIDSILFEHLNPPRWNPCWV